MTTSARLRSSVGAAAIELDNIALGRGTKTASINQLIAVLEADVPLVGCRDVTSMITPMVLVMDRAVRKASPTATLNDVVREYFSLLEGLRRVATHIDLEALNRDEPDLIRGLRDRCLALSWAASSFRRPPLLQDSRRREGG